MLKALVVLVAVGLSVYCLYDIVATPARSVRVMPKPVWVLVVLVPLVGPLAWLLSGRRAPKSGPPPKPRPRVIGPDDDPDFLWRMEQRERRSKRQGGDDDPPTPPQNA
ncbi:MAG: PLDc N-terminal domain-containing protein [Actinomycetota bacterium]|nr:PLDc N-terminal domain-containing protein [Actinomycetota bacterium]